MSGRKKSSGWEHDLALRGVKFANVLAVTAVFAAAWYMCYCKLPEEPLTCHRFLAVICLYAVLYIGFGKLYDAFLVSINRISEMVLSQVLAELIAGGLLYAAFWVAGTVPVSLWTAVLVLAVQSVLSTLWCYFANRWYFRTFCARKCVIVYESREDLEVLMGQSCMGRKFLVQAAVTTGECLENMPQLFRDCDSVFLWGMHSHERNIILKYCVEHGIRSYLIPRVGDMIINGGRVIHLCHMPVLSVGRFAAAPGYRCCKRLADILICSAALLVLSPVMLVTAAAIWLTDRGPVFYRQTRLTKDGRTFRILKFRSMWMDAEKNGIPRLSAGKADPRVTPVGRIIRTVRIDELPQLFNIIRGDMSLVGPRPERPEIAAEYEKILPEFSLRLQVPAGLTGYAQVYGKYNTPPYEKLQMDLMYISHASLWEDFRIILATVKTLFTVESTEGIPEGQTTAMK